jgi:hypothetical protein
MCKGVEMFWRFEKKQKRFKKFLFSITAFLLMVIVIAGCAYFKCFEANDLPPDILLSCNEYVCTAEFFYADTIVNIGVFKYLGGKEEFCVIEYSYRPMEIYKNSGEIDTLFFWKLVSRRLKDNYTNARAYKNRDVELVYGNTLNGHHDILNLMESYSIASTEEIICMLKGDSIEAVWSALEDDSLLALAILNNNELKEKTEDGLNKNRLIIYGTEHHMWTQSSFNYGHLEFCDRNTFKGSWVSSKEYLELLRELAAGK